MEMEKLQQVNFTGHRFSQGSIILIEFFLCEVYDEAHSPSDI